MMRRRALFWVIVGGVVFCTSCVTMPSVRRNEDISRRIRKDMIDFYENMAQAYWLLGFGYYELHKEAVASDSTEAAEKYRKHAALYKTYAEDLKKSVDVWRKSLETPESSSRLLPAEDQAFAAREAPTSGSLEPLAPTRPAEGKRSVLDRVRFWRRKS
ncbi:hypothetical protein AMJ85_07400 [candidate division BRC1 bacterium SM23_51]|nr:MAG: hypothetical protein AMJ85_07400 [candidate division BRC1 bacterium SM23_51]